VKANVWRTYCVFNENGEPERSATSSIHSHLSRAERHCKFGKPGTKFKSKKRPQQPPKILMDMHNIRIGCSSIERALPTKQENIQPTNSWQQNHIFPTKAIERGPPANVPVHTVEIEYKREKRAPIQAREKSTSARREQKRSTLENHCPVVQRRRQKAGSMFQNFRNPSCQVWLLHKKVVVKSDLTFKTQKKLPICERVVVKSTPLFLRKLREKVGKRPCPNLGCLFLVPHTYLVSTSLCKSQVWQDLYTYTLIVAIVQALA